MAERRTKFVSASLTREARDALSATAFGLTCASGQRVTMSEALMAALAVVQLHTSEAIAELRGDHR
jgi:hypothetical protein